MRHKNRRPSIQGPHEILQNSMPNQQEIVFRLGDFRRASFAPENAVRSEQRTVLGRTSDRQFGTKTCANQDQNKRGQGTSVERHEQ